MSNLFSTADSGVGNHKTFFPLHEKVSADIPIGKGIPLSCEMAYAGDIWHLKNEIFIRTQAMKAPLLTDMHYRMNYYFVPLRLIDSNTELIITGSKEGKFDADVVIPEYPGMFDDASTSKAVDKYSILDYLLGMPIGDYSNIYQQKCMPARYFLDAYWRIWFDWYRDENLSAVDDFDTFIAEVHEAPGKSMCFNSNWRKDYFTSALPWQQKGIAPAINLDVVNPDLGSTVFPVDVSYKYNGNEYSTKVLGSGSSGVTTASVLQTKESAQIFTNNELFFNVDMTGSGGTFNTSDLRIMVQEQRILERLARCGSRYTEYLHANFGIAPDDGTLQRAQYLGGFKQNIVSSEVMQTAEDGTNPVGTLRGKGISMARNSMDTFVCKEPGVIIGIGEVMPRATYTQGIPRKFTAKSRWDFMNPSFQNLSEQEVRNGEVYINFNNDEGDDSDENFNDDTFGFQEMYSELKTSKDRVCGDLRDQQSYWCMSRFFTERPNLNESFITTDGEDFGNPFAVTDLPPIIIECGNLHSAWRPLTKFGTPGLVDHF